MTGMIGRTWLLVAALAAVSGALAPSSAQTPGDTVRAWTEALRSGTLVERITAAGKLARRDDVAGLPLETRSALIAELERVNRALLDERPLDGQEELRGEDFGEYYMDLAAAVGRFDSREARRALIPAVAFSGRTQQRVAVMGDEAVRGLSELIDRDFETTAALETLALAWFWADSTGAPLSDLSRAAVLDHILEQIARDENRMGAVGALEYTGDPAFLPLAELVASRGGSLASGIAGAWVVPALQARAEGSDALDLARGTERLIRLVCRDAPSGSRSDACAPIARDHALAVERLRAGRTDPLAGILDRVIRRADDALRAGTLSPEEHALIAGGARQVLDKLLPPTGGTGS